MRVTAIVVNFNAGDHLRHSIEALLASSDIISVIVVDNSSTDGSLRNAHEMLQSNERVSLIANARNEGFARAVNQALSGVRSEATLVINPDCVLPAPTLAAMTAVLTKEINAGLVAPWVINPDGTSQRANRRRLPATSNAIAEMLGGSRLSSNLGVDQSGTDQPREALKVDAVSGAVMLFRTESLTRLGGFDEGYQLHCEDLDIMQRLTDANFEIWLVPETAVHEQGVSSRSRVFWVHYQKHRSYSRYYRKFLSTSGGVLSSWLIHLGIWGHWVVTLPQQLVRAINARLGTR